MVVVESRTFWSGGRVAVELPDELAFGPDLAVMIERHGDTLTIRRLDESAHVRSGATLAAALRAFPPVPERETRQPPELPAVHACR